MKKVYTVATSHLDTIWCWDFETTVSKYIYNTLVDNFALLKKYPTYTFSFEGSYRYELMQEYYPELFEELKKYIAEGRWNVTGSAFENGDVNCPSPEALFRNILIGNTYFDETFGKRSCDIFLPDCFGFGWALPSIIHHSNLMGFTTQKLGWGGAYGVPFDIGKWYGVDGNFVWASTNPHAYYFTLTKLRDWDFVVDKLKKNEEYGLDWTYLFHGIGDRGGAPEEASVKFVEEEISKNDSSDIQVIATSADQIFRDIETKLPDEVKEKLPEWKTELVMKNHGVGGYTSRAIGKRWNARGQELADIAERLSLEASYFGASSYNENVLEKAWKRLIAHQFHDDTPGTSVQRAYRRSWNDYALSMNSFSGEIEASLSGLTKLMKSDGCIGTPVLVSNSVEAKRTGAVIIKLRGINSPHVRVFNNRGREVKSQIISDIDSVKEILFIAEVDSLGVRVYDVRESDTPCRLPSAMSVTERGMENQKYVVSLNARGNITSIIDKEDDERELLESPIVFGLFNYTGSKEWPAWEMNFDEANKEPDRIPDIVSIKVAETGPARVAIEVKQKDKKSLFTTYISLTDGGKTVEVFNEIEWQSMRTLCKNRFALTVSNKKASFDLGLGVIQRENMNENLFEVPAQKWADITDESGEFGVSIISECKHGWDKFSDNTLRLTAIHTPKKNYRIDSMQSMMDLGLNRYSYAIFSHKGEVGADTQLEARFFTSPMTAVAFDKHQGALKTDYSFGKVSTNDVIIRALKKAHHKDNNEYIVRFNEGTNKSVKGFTFTIGDGIESAKEIWASEEYRNEAKVENGKLICDFEPYEVKSFAFTLKEPKIKAEMNKCSPAELEFGDENKALPKELVPGKLSAFGADFVLDGKAFIGDGKTTVKIKTDANKLMLLCAAKEDSKLKFTVDGEEIEKQVNALDKPFAGWDLYDLKETAFIKNGHLGFEATHSLDENGNVAFAKGLYYWIVSLDVKQDSEVILPEGLIVLAASEVKNSGASLVTRLYDEVENNRELTFKKNFKEQCWYFTSKLRHNMNDKDDYFKFKMHNA